MTVIRVECAVCQYYLCETEEYVGGSLLSHVGENGMLISELQQQHSRLAGAKPYLVCRPGVQYLYSS